MIVTRNSGFGLRGQFLVLLLVGSCVLAGACSGPQRVAGPSSLGAGEYITPASGDGAQVARLRGRLSGKDGVRDNRSFTDLYSFWARAGDAIEIRMNSAPLDTYLLLYNAEGQVIAEDDDSGGNLNSLLRTTLSEPGLYVVSASSYSREEGAYDLRVTLNSGSVLYPLIPIPITIEQHFDNDDPRSTGYYSPFRAWALDLSAGQSLTVEMRSEDVDSLLILFDEAGTQVALDDDSLGAPDAQLTYSAANAGRYFLVTTAPYVYEDADFELTVR